MAWDERWKKDSVKSSPSSAQSTLKIPAVTLASLKSAELSPSAGDVVSQGGGAVSNPDLMFNRLKPLKIVTPTPIP